MSERSPLSRRRFVQLSAAAVAATALPTPSATAAQRGGTCDPLGTTPSFRGLVPSPEDVLGFPIGVDREITSDEIVTYLDAVGAVGDRVTVGTLGFEPEGPADPLRDRRRPRQRHPRGAAADPPEHPPRSVTPPRPRTRSTT